MLIYCMVSLNPACPFPGLPDGVAQSVACLTADPGVLSSITARSHIFMEIDHEIISTAVLLPFPDSRRVGVNYKQKYVQVQTS